MTTIFGHLAKVRLSFSNEKKTNKTIVRITVMRRPNFVRIFEQNVKLDQGHKEREYLKTVSVAG